MFDLLPVEIKFVTMLAAEQKPISSPEMEVGFHDSIPAWKQILEPVEPFLSSVNQQLATQVLEFEPKIATFAQYALNLQGKQLRPLLVALSGEAAGGLNEKHVNLAVIIEMVHLATLVHDDIMDGADLRRGLPTLAATWGNEISVLLGDCLFAHALKLASSYPTTEICRAVSSSTNTVCSGEILQTLGQKNFSLSRAEYFKILGMKTAELFSLACDLGAFLAEAPSAVRRSLNQYGQNLGVAYQIYDDCVDFFGCERRVGKSLGTDLAKGKITLPILIVLERGSAEEKEKLKEWIRDWNVSRFPGVLHLLNKHGALSESRRMIDHYLGEARKQIEELPVTKSKFSLNALTDFLSQQTDALGVHS